MNTENIKKKIIIGNSLVYYSIYFLYKKDKLTKFRQKAFLNAYRNKNFIIRTTIYFYSFFIWPFNLLRQIYTFTKVRGKYVKQVYKKSYLIQVLEQLQLGLLHTVPVRSYYNYQFYIKENKKRHYEYLYNHEVSYLFDYLSKYADKTLLGDKYKFYLFCKENKIPTVPILELITRNTKTLNLPEQDLFIKPRLGSAGKGISKWKYNSSYYVNNVGGKINKNELENSLLKQAQKQDYIIQPVIKIDKSLSNFTKKALPTIRLISKHSKNGVEIIVAYQKVVLNKSIIDNSAFGFPIDVETGKMYTPNTTLHNKLKKESKINNENYLVISENWRNIKDMVNKTHQLLSQYNFLAFDIVINQNIPKIIEINHNWDVCILQQACDERLLALKMLYF